VKYADLVNWQVGPEEFAAKSHVLARLCEEAGRDPASLRRTHAPNFQYFDSEREFRLWRQHPDRGMSAAEVDAYVRKRGAFYGTAPAISETIEEYISLGCGGFIVYCNRAPAQVSLEQLASLIPAAGRAGASQLFT
jgi:alkanesulfonate monooxygenase SsuD/methylene tetrahydromethanopterin reductase-like flavin-dependent oxidoreductase (luciferase family)